MYTLNSLSSGIACIPAPLPASMASSLLLLAVLPHILWVGIQYLLVSSKVEFVFLLLFSNVAFGELLREGKMLNLLHHLKIL